MWKAQRHMQTLQHTAYTGSNDLLHESPNYYIKRIKLRLKNLEGRQWSLLAKRNLPPGTVLGFYTGTLKYSTHKSLYALELYDDFSIFPFQDEDNIAYHERSARPFSNMNEPIENTTANCRMVMIDFKRSEVRNVKSIHNYKQALFFRGVVCVTCRSVSMHDELTWHYGRTYESHRKTEGYKVGKPCVYTLDESFISTIQPSHDSVYPIFDPINSNRFNFESSSSEGETFVPSGTREERIQNRSKRKAMS